MRTEITKYFAEFIERALNLLTLQSLSPILQRVIGRSKKGLNNKNGQNKIHILSIRSKLLNKNICTDARLLCSKPLALSYILLYSQSVITLERLCETVLKPLE